MTAHAAPSMIDEYIRQIEKAKRTMARLPKELRDLFDAEARENLQGTHVEAYFNERNRANV